MAVLPLCCICNDRIFCNGFETRHIGVVGFTMSTSLQWLDTPYGGFEEYSQLV